eukprot:CAMPEP_0116013088 /NCGR_PEP_ID=MMETSP0321-20121206/5518_1 /TAXON_ID=163516 /ORGANISM="Leptocylindrus danicus var. danicus, Strain B650" /LENGTH=1036 /DNA_ID=CAMNT_0003482571 /DNA_START=413 /DNA_END=3523 /DNA_ORIENTATION=+
MSAQAGLCYPYSRAQECAWQPEEASKALSALASTSTSSVSGVSADNNTLLLSRGHNSNEIPYIRGRYGKNDLNTDDNETSSNIVLILLAGLKDQLKEPLIGMLTCSAILSLVLGNTADAVSITTALLIVCLVAVVQEYRSNQALERLNDLMPHTCTVLRDGACLANLEASQLVVGDLVLLSTGDRVPADLRLVDGVELAMDESSLTGENTPVHKTSAALSLPATAHTTTNCALPLPLTEQRNIVFMGTLVCSGRGRALVVAVGKHTEIGKISCELAEIEERKSPLQIKIDELGQKLATYSSLFIALIALLGWMLGKPFLETVTVAVSLAVAAIPEGLPICVTVTLALGVLRMARRNAIVKKLPVVESLGCTTVVASDKTGTLTKNQMTARSVYSLAFPQQKFCFTGVGYVPAGGKLIRDEGIGKNAEILPTSIEYTALSPILGVGAICNNASYSASGVDSVEGRSGPALSGQPTELALLVAAMKAGIDDPRPLYHRLQEVPFTSDRKRMEVKARPVGGSHTCFAFTIASDLQESKMGGSSSDHYLYFVKGMPEAVVGECKTFTESDGSAAILNDFDRQRALSHARMMASDGLRVLAMAYGTSLDALTFAGLIGMEDPPREGVTEAVHSLREGGVTTIMVTGDSKETAFAVARRCGILGDAGKDISDMEYGATCALSGAELDGIPTRNLPDSIGGVRIFYRVSPRHKLSLVRALQQHGEIVAMTGDGVNDATALKAADIGIAMGKSGTDVAKEAADVVLTDDDFSTITQAISEGKGIFFNIRNFLAFQLSTSFAALAIESIATAIGLPSPLNAMQILWINIIMDGPPAQSLGVEPVDPRILKAKPRKPNENIVTKALLRRAVTSAILIVFLTLKVFDNELDDGRVTKRDTTMTFMTFVNCDLFNAYACRSSNRCFYEMNILDNVSFVWAILGSVIGQLAVIYFPPLQKVFQTEALRMKDLLYIIILSSTVLMLDTIRKKFFSFFFSDTVAPASDKKQDDQVMFDQTDDLFLTEMNSYHSKERSRTIRSRTGSSVVIT